MAAILRIFGKPYRAACGHRKYGLLYHDLLVETPVVVEAVRRLPIAEQEKRWRRLKVASHLAITQQLLPKEEWVKDEEDIPYLAPYIAEVQQEMKDRESFHL